MLFNMTTTRPPQLQTPRVPIYAESSKRYELEDRRILTPCVL
jgi:hypothetical protein